MQGDSRSSIYAEYASPPPKKGGVLAVFQPQMPVFSGFDVNRLRSARFEGAAILTPRLCRGMSY